MPDAPLVGRDDELAQLGTALRTARSGAGRADPRHGIGPASPVAVVTGPAGIGKSTLLAAAARQATDTGALALTGAATEFEATAPLAAVTTALTPLVAALTDTDRHALGTDRLADLAAAFPWLPDPAAGPTGPARGLGDERYRVARAIAALLDRAAARRPVLLVVEDVHWADPASVEVVTHLLRRRVPGVLLALSHRTGLLDPALRRALTTTIRPEIDLRIELGPLTAAAADALLGDAVAPARRAQLYAGSGGNPFHLLALARHGGPPGAMPETVLDALRAEITALAEPVRVLLQGAAVAGDPFDPAVAAPAAGVSLDDALDAVDTLAAIGLIGLTDDPRMFRFRHPLVRQAVYELAGPAWRTAAHARLDGALAAAAAPVLDRAPHIAASARPGDADAVALLGAAGAAAAAWSPATAAHWFRTALDLLDDDAPDRPRLLFALAKALRTSGRLPQARATLDELVALLPEGPDRADVLTLAANLDHILGRHAEAGALLTHALDALPDQRSPAAARLQMALCSVGMHTCDYPWMRATAAEATAIARAGDDPALLTSAVARLAVAEYHVADIQAARAACDEAEHLLAGLDERALARRMDAVAWLGWAHWFVERYEQAEATFTLGRDITRRRGLGYVLPELLAGRALTLVHRGRLTEADEEATDARDAAELTGSALAMAMAVMTLSEVAVLRGDNALAMAYAKESLAGIDETDRAARVLSSPALADAQLAAGDPAAARETLLAEGGGAELVHVERAWRARWYEILTLAALADGDLPAAHCWAARAEAVAAGCGLAGRTATAHRARAAVLLARTGQNRADGARAIEAATAAAALFEQIGSPVEAARARVLAGRALAAAGRVDDAVPALRAAEALAATTGAGAVRAAAVAALRTLGRRPGTGERRQLTDREREIAVLAAEGLSNKEIASVLVLSERTVEGHLGRARAKLHVRSRAGLGAALADPR